MKKQKKPLNERQLVNLLIKALKKNSPGIYIHVDRDSGNMRHTSSGWDFLAVWEGRTVFCECKIGNGKLTDWQETIRLEVRRAAGNYKIIRFNPDADKNSFWVKEWVSAGLQRSVLSDEITGEWLTV